MYIYKAHCTAVYDADTITVDIDLGFGVWLKDQKLRLYGINAPEMRGEDKPFGTQSRDRLRERILLREVLISTRKDKKGKYGRWLATILLDGENINEWLVANGLAVREYYGDEPETIN